MKNINLTVHLSHLQCEGCVCYAAKKNSFVIGSDAKLYKCTADFEYEKNMVGNINTSGQLELNENYYNWVNAAMLSSEKCNNCFYSACCLSMNCPANTIRNRNQKNNICMFEKEYLGDFLELFNEKNFVVLGESKI